MTLLDGEPFSSKDQIWAAFLQEIEQRIATFSEASSDNKVVPLVVSPDREERPSLICPQEGSVTFYRPVIFTYDRHVQKGFMFVARTQAHVCVDCKSVYYQPEIINKIIGELRTAVDSLGLRSEVR